MPRPLEPLIGWDTNDTNSMEPPVAKQEDGWVAGDRPPASWINYLHRTWGQWAAFLAENFPDNESHAWPTPVSRTTYVAPSRLLSIPGTTGAAPGWTVANPGAGSAQGFHLESAENFAKAVLPLSDILPSGATVEEIAALVTPGAARGSGSRISLSWYSAIYDFVTAPGVTYDGFNNEVEDDGTTDTQVLAMDTSGLITINSETNTHQAVLTAGNDAGSNPDELLVIRLQWTDAGLSNL